MPLPNREYLLVHFRIAEILDVSGVGKKIEDALDEGLLDAENMKPDGSTDIGSILSRKMLRVI